MGEVNGSNSVRFELHTKQSEHYQIRDFVNKKVIATFYDKAYADAFLALLRLWDPVKRTPRVVKHLTEDCRDSEWISDNGSRYRCVDDYWEFKIIDASRWTATCDPIPGLYLGTFTEVVD